LVGWEGGDNRVFKVGGDFFWRASSEREGKSERVREDNRRLPVPAYLDLRHHETLAVARLRLVRLLDPK
jgi:hypothetical protein